MKVLLISPQMEKPNGGIAIWTNLYLRDCKDHGIDCDLVNTAAVGQRLTNGNARRQLFCEIIRTRRIFKDLKMHLKAQCYNIVHLNTSCGFFGIFRDMLIARYIRKADASCAIVVHYHCDIPFQIKNRLGMWCLKKITVKSDAQFVLCRSSKLFLQKKIHTDSIVVPNLIDECNIAQSKKKIRDSINTIFFVGCVSLEKGAAEIYELARRFPTICFQLAGVVDQEVSDWEQPQNLILLGGLPHNNVLRKMDEADLFLFPSYSEGFSMALTESMARGLPAIATDVGANLDMLENKGGFVVSVGDIDAMENAIKSLLDSSVRTEMSYWCVEKVKKQYSSHRVIELFCSEYEKINRRML